MRGMSSIAVYMYTYLFKILIYRSIQTYLCLHIYIEVNYDAEEQPIQSKIGVYDDDLPLDDVITLPSANSVPKESIHKVTQL